MDSLKKIIRNLLNEMYPGYAPTDTITRTEPDTDTKEPSTQELPKNQIEDTIDELLNNRITNFNLDNYGGDFDFFDDVVNKLRDMYLNGQDKRRVLTALSNIFNPKKVLAIQNHIKKNNEKYDPFVEHEPIYMWFMSTHENLEKIIQKYATSNSLTNSILAAFNQKAYDFYARKKKPEKETKYYQPKDSHEMFQYLYDTEHPEISANFKKAINTIGDFFIKNKKTAFGYVLKDIIASGLDSREIIDLRPKIFLTPFLKQVIQTIDNDDVKSGIMEKMIGEYVYLKKIYNKKVSTEDIKTNAPIFFKELLKRISFYLRNLTASKSNIAMINKELEKNGIDTNIIDLTKLTMNDFINHPYSDGGAGGDVKNNYLHPTRRDDYGGLFEIRRIIRESINYLLKENHKTVEELEKEMDEIYEKIKIASEKNDRKTISKLSDQMDSIEAQVSKM